MILLLIILVFTIARIQQNKMAQEQFQCKKIYQNLKIKELKVLLLHLIMVNLLLGLSMTNNFKIVNLKEETRLDYQVLNI